MMRDALADECTPPVPATGGEPFSLANPATAERLLTGAGFSDVQVTDVREPVYYGPNAEAACDAVRSLRLTQGLAPAQAEHVIQRLQAILATRQTADGVWFDSRAWIITAHRQ